MKKKRSMIFIHLLSLFFLTLFTFLFSLPLVFSSSNSNTLFLEPSSRTTQSLPPPPPPSLSPPFRHRYCHSFPSKYPPSICNTQFRQFLIFPPPPPPSSSSSEIDPRYGVEKRLVPSGPNPLHN